MLDQTYDSQLQTDAPAILSRLIEFGYAPTSPPALPPVWQGPFEAVLRSLSFGRSARWDAFKNALAGRPDAYDLYEQVLQLTRETEDRAAQNRILYTAEDAIKPPPVLDWCVAGLLAQPSLTVLVGDPGAKKTYLAIDLAVSVALGQPWLGRSTAQSPVLIIDEESGLLQLWGRLHASLHAHGAPASTPLHFTSLAGYDLRDDRDAEALIHRALSVNARLIVIDALGNLMRGAGENNLSSVQPVLFHLRRMAEFCGAAVVAIHHTNRHGVFRGSSSISASVDLMLSVESAPQDSLISLRALKARFLAPEPFCARAHFETAPDGSQRFHLTASDEKPVANIPLQSTSPNGIASTVLVFLASNPQATRQQIIAHCSGASHGSVRNALYQLLNSGLVKRANAGKRGKKAVYDLA